MENPRFKNSFWFILDAFLVGLIIFLFLHLMPMMDRMGSSKISARTINISAEGKTTAKPDLAQFSFSVVSEGADLEKIAKENNDKVTEAVKFVKEEGISDDDIKTTQYNLNPKYEYDRNRNRSYIVGYELTQTVFVKVKELDQNIGKVSKILGNLPEMGINQISGVSFTFEDPEKFLAEARTDAFEKAKTKASAIAKASGVKLGEVINVSEYQNNPRIEYLKYGVGGGVDMASSISAPIQTGTEEITVQVNITYALR